MTSPSKNKAVFRYLLAKSLDGQATPSEIQQLNHLLKNYPDLEKDYFDNVLLQFFLPEAQIAVGFKLDADATLSAEFWTALAEYEKAAPEFQIPREKPSRELIQKVVYPPREKRKVSKFNVVFLALNAAAILFIVLFLKFAPPKSGVEVATLTDSIDAKWADDTGSMSEGARLFTGGDTLFLQEGLAELLFDNNTKVVIEGPAEFGLLAVDRIDLRYGRAYTTVPQEAIGFTINTPISRIIDLGTEFGVQADTFGNVSLHVIKGKTTLIAGHKSSKINLEVTAGQAKKVCAATQEVSDIPCKTGLFVRDISSGQKFIWKGQTELSLADIVGGGNGLGTGRRNTGINPATGMKTGILQRVRERNRGNTYRNIGMYPFIDGVFVPNGQTRQVISSLGHVFSECPVTQGNFYTEISNTPNICNNRELGLVLGGVNYSQGESRSLFMHANLGITYDLQAIRSQLVDVDIVRFRSTIGISDTSPRLCCNADFWILVDGQLRYSKVNVQQKGIILDTVDIELSEHDRFLTLVTTDGGDPSAYKFENEIFTSIDSDWCFFVEPVLVLE